MFTSENYFNYVLILTVHNVFIYLWNKSFLKHVGKLNTNYPCWGILCGPSAHTSSAHDQTAAVRSCTQVQNISCGPLALDCTWPKSGRACMQPHASPQNYKSKIIGGPPAQSIHPKNINQLRIPSWATFIFFIIHLDMSPGIIQICSSTQVFFVKAMFFPEFE